MRSPVAVAAVCFLASTCGARAPGGSTGSPPAPIAPQERRALCEGIDNYYACSRAVERALLSKGADRVTRTGDTLVIRLSDGGERTLVDRGTDAKTVRLTYGGYLDRIGYHLVNVHLYESGTYLLIDDATGQEMRAAAPPVVSPDGRRVVIASHEGEAGYRPNVLQVWRVTPDGLFVEWDARPEDWGAVDARWEDTATVRFVKATRCELRDVCRAEATLRLRDGEWGVVEGA